MIFGNFSETSKKVLLEVIIGILLFAAAASLIVLFLPVEKLPAISGLLLGALLNIASMVHITYVTELIVDAHDQQYATRYTMISYLVRMLIMGAALIFACKSNYLNMLTLAFGLFGIKAGAYLQPSVHRFLERHVYKGRK